MRIPSLTNVLRTANCSSASSTLSLSLPRGPFFLGSSFFTSSAHESPTRQLYLDQINVPCALRISRSSSKFFCFVPPSYAHAYPSVIIASLRDRSASPMYNHPRRRPYLPTPPTSSVRITRSSSPATAPSSFSLAQLVASIPRAFSSRSLVRFSGVSTPATRTLSFLYRSNPRSIVTSIVSPSRTLSIVVTRKL